MTVATIGRAFEFVLLDEPRLDTTADDRAFAAKFASAAQGRQVVAFPNLGNDAVLVVPCPAGPPTAYAHVAAFVGNAPAEQVHDLWRAVGEAMRRAASAPDRPG